MRWITSLETLGKHWAAKTLYLDGKGEPALHPFNAGWAFKPNEVNINSINQFHQFLLQAEMNPKGFIISGKIKAEAKNKPWIRRRYIHPKGGNDVEESDVVLCPLDIDKLQLSFIGKEPPVSQYSPGELAEATIKNLIPEFANTSYCVQISNSTGWLVDDKVGLHLFFILQSPTRLRDIKQWVLSKNMVLKKYLGQDLLDPSLYNPVQPIYIARPRLSTGVSDPFPIRTELVLK